jgi:sugar/nucleoside kinase (ribokinase family)
VTRVVCVGDLMVDVHARLPGALALGSDTPATVTFPGGGSAANTAAWLVAAGAAATFAGRVGADPLGAQATGDLQAAGVELLVTVDPELSTGVCIVLVAPDGERTMIPSAGANARGAAALTPAQLAGARLHLSGYALFHDDARTAALRTLAAARTAGCAVSVDAASSAPLRQYGAQRFLDDVAPCLLFANADEATVLTGAADPDGAVRGLGERTGAAIVKLGARGACWSDGHDVVTVPGQGVAVVDSTGAGDAFAAGVLAALTAGSPVPGALAAGQALAVRAVGRPGARP